MLNIVWIYLVTIYKILFISPDVTFLNIVSHSHKTTFCISLNILLIIIINEARSGRATYLKGVILTLDNFPLTLPDLASRGLSTDLLVLISKAMFFPTGQSTKVLFCCCGWSPIIKHLSPSKKITHTYPSCDFKENMYFVPSIIVVASLSTFSIPVSIRELIIC